MEADIKRTKRPKRTVQQVEIELMNALEHLVSERGFQNISIIELAEKANISPTIIYRKYGTLDKLYGEFVGKYDFWMSETLNMSNIRTLGDRRFYAEALKTLFRKLAGDTVMQKVLIYEISEDNAGTRKAANLRETLNLSLIAYYENIFKPAKIDINSITACFIAGIYYLVLHKDRSTFCTVDFRTNEGQERFCKAIDMHVDILFDRLEQKERLKATISRMLDDGISQNKISEYLDITPAQLRKYI